MKAIIVRDTAKAFEVLETTTDDLINFAASKGYVHCGFNFSPSQREQLQNQPKFKGLMGPFWDGDKIRYEDPAVFEILSR